MCPRGRASQGCHPRRRRCRGGLIYNILRACQERKAKRAQQEQQQHQQQQQSIHSYPQDDSITFGPPKAMLTVKEHQGMGNDVGFIDQSQPTKGCEEEEKEELAIPPPPYDAAIDEVKVGSSYGLSK